ncbi:RusA family crossover junction endodeoxyribonuclease [Cellulosimicrobium sp. 72-3]|uniref:RusA family crossover junction endodeoxyribonuclease n=1 Tax=Cellulosimicrobium sp. 72-3 TaxID=2731680 RepID=UPI00148EE9D6|nr:RusA family crossover junction endodeoxyribonuclease [Cellulosimicrobium sp. 72-3]
MARRSWTPLVTVDIEGFPATFATARERDWKTAVSAVLAAWRAEHPEHEPAAHRYSVELEFRLGPARHRGEVWDIDNLAKPTLDAMAAVLGQRDWAGRPQPADDRVDRLLATKRQPLTGEQPGVRITVETSPA